MHKFTNPLDKIKIASPCGADWNEMRGGNRRRYCTMCKLNVYNLSGMTQTEAESFLINSEGRVCLRVFRRTDGTVITKDCPVGWQIFKRETSRLAKAFVSICAGIFGGVFAFNQFQPNPDFTDKNSIKVSPINLTVPLNKIENSENVSAIPSSPSPDVSHERSMFNATVGVLELEVKKPNSKEITSKKTRRR